MNIVKTSLAPKAIGPYSQAIVEAGLVFLSGQIAIDPKTSEMVGGGILEQTVQVISNIREVLKASGTSIEKVLKTTVFLKDMSDFSLMNTVYEKHFTSKPARSTVAVASLPKDALVEIEVVAKI